MIPTVSYPLIGSASFTEGLTATFPVVTTPRFAASGTEVARFLSELSTRPVVRRTAGRVARMDTRLEVLSG